jgi:hypothetical protein
MGQPAGRGVGFKAPLYEPNGPPRVVDPCTAGDSVRTRGICSCSLPLAPVRTTLGTALLSSFAATAGAVPRFLASGETDLQQTNAVVWVMIAISAVGAIITFAFLTYALWKFRDPKVKGRRYG